MTDSTETIATEAIQEAPTPDAGGPEEEPATFTTEYVKRLRSEASERRREAKAAREELEARDAELVELREARLHRAVVDVNAGRPARLADVSDLWTFRDASDLVDDDGRPDPARIETAIEGLLRAKPHLRENRVTGSVDQGARGILPPAPPSIGALIGRAARGEVVDR